jgi:plastocyanin
MICTTDNGGIGRACHALVLTAALVAGMAVSLRSGSAAMEANRLTLAVVDPGGDAVEQAIVWAVPVSGQVLPPAPRATAEIRQVDSVFVPAVTPVRVGTAVNFPNLDDVRHNVYSFSPAKIFSLSLYLGTHAEPVVFDKPGEVVIGCNIHDRMLAYVLALETPYFGTTGANGRVQLAGLVPGEYELHAWHPDQKAAPATRRLTVRAHDKVDHRFTAEVTRRWLPPARD